MSPSRINNSADATDRMQNIVNEWEAVSKVTGGVLAPKKCWAWIIGFNWTRGSWSYKPLNNSVSMTVKDEDDVNQQMTLLEASEAKEMLGVNLAPDGNHHTQFEISKQKMKRFAELICTGHVNKHEALVNLNMMCLKSFEYILPYMTFSEEEHCKIMVPVLKQFLPKLGINRNFPRAMLYAPISFQGINLHNPYLTQGIMQINNLVEHTWKNTLTSNLFCCNLEQLRIELGSNTSILESNYNEFKYCLLTDLLITSTWKFMSDNNITWRDNTAELPLFRKNNMCIMDSFRKNMFIPSYELVTLNKCRLYLKVFLLSDIVDSSGIKIRDNIWHGRQCNAIQVETV